MPSICLPPEIALELGKDAEDVEDASALSLWTVL
jgi:hypothetical protein